MIGMADVHAAHCCTAHGCTRSAWRSVTMGTVPQEYPCEQYGEETELDPTGLLPGGIVVRLGDHEISGCHCDVRVTVIRRRDP